MINATIMFKVLIYKLLMNVKMRTKQKIRLMKPRNQQNISFMHYSSKCVRYIQFVLTQDMHLRSNDNKHIFYD